jgi:hypothetical protein
VLQARPVPMSATIYVLGLLTSRETAYVEGGAQLASVPFSWVRFRHIRHVGFVKKNVSAELGRGFPLRRDNWRNKVRAETSTVRAWASALLRRQMVEACSPCVCDLPRLERPVPGRGQCPRLRSARRLPTVFGRQFRQAGSFLKEISAIQRAICRKSLVDEAECQTTTTFSNGRDGPRCRSYLAPEPASRTRPRRIRSTICHRVRPPPLEGGSVVRRADVWTKRLEWRGLVCL